MNLAAGLLWDRHQIFHRLVEDCGIRCDVITPHLLATPFFRGNYVALIVPTGFGNPAYSRLLPALRACSERIERFIEAGGRVLVYGAADCRPDAYDWLPFPLTYQHAYSKESIVHDPAHQSSCILDGYDTSEITTDGHFTRSDATPIAWNSRDEPVLVGRQIGSGLVLAATIHEYPSRKFLAQFCSNERETLF